MPVVVEIGWHYTSIFQRLDHRLTEGTQQLDWDVYDLVYNIVLDVQRDVEGACYMIDRKWRVLWYFTVKQQ